MWFAGLVVGFCFIASCSCSYASDPSEVRERRAPYPTECCMCDDHSTDQSRWCSTPGVCEKYFTRCDYCETLKTFTATGWKTTRGCSVESACIANWYLTVTVLGCIDNTRGDPAVGTTCYSCCRTPSPLKPHYCTVSPDTHFIRFNLTTVPTTTTTTTITTTTTTKPTTTGVTAVDGNWSDWGPWHGCESDCTGRRIRIRACDNPLPSGGGATCPGAGFQQEYCGATNCKPGVSIVG